MICPFSGEPCDNSKTIMSHGYHICDTCKIPQPKKESTMVKSINTPKDLIKLLKNKEVIVKSKCPKCGLKIEEFNFTGKFGCAYCYEYYREEFIALAGPYHNQQDDLGDKFLHVGKRPKHFKSKEEEIKVLKLLIAKAKELENYELAAEYKAKLTSLQ
jgi:protein-arginine kinase activator protein McsA